MPLYTLTLTLSHTLTITCTCTSCYEVICGAQDGKMMCSHVNSLILSHNPSRSPACAALCSPSVYHPPHLLAQFMLSSYLLVGCLRTVGCTSSSPSISSLSLLPSFPPPLNLSSSPPLLLSSSPPLILSSPPLILSHCKGVRR